MTQTNFNIRLSQDIFVIFSYCLLMKNRNSPTEMFHLLVFVEYSLYTINQHSYHLYLEQMDEIGGGVGLLRARVIPLRTVIAT